MSRFPREFTTFFIALLVERIKANDMAGRDKLVKDKVKLYKKWKEGVKK
jgi:hypothetical protein